VLRTRGVETADAARREFIERNAKYVQNLDVRSIRCFARAALKRRMPLRLP
jgi:hypothetical protein